MVLWQKIIAVMIIFVLFSGVVGVTAPAGVQASTASNSETAQVANTAHLSQLLASLQELLKNLKGYMSQKSPLADACVDDWQEADLTWFSSYPEAGSDECRNYNGCEWAGKFAGVSSKKLETWVAAHNIAAVHEDFYDEYKGKWLVIRNTETRNNIKAQVLDMCSDSDCDGCCTRNMQETGFLIDLEKYTAERFFGDDDLGNTSVDWCVSQ